MLRVKVAGCLLAAVGVASEVGAAERAVFEALTPAGVRRLFITDGTKEGTRPLASQAPANEAIFSALVPVGGRAVGVTLDRLYGIEATGAIRLIRHFPYGHRFLMSGNGKAYFANDRKIIVTDGTYAGTRVGWTVNTSSSDYQMAIVNGHFLGVYRPSSGGGSIFQDLRVPSRTFQIDQLYAGPIGGGPVAPGKMVFGCSYRSNWRTCVTDGTKEGTKVFAGGGLGSSQGLEPERVMYGNRLLLRDESAYSLYSTDGTVTNSRRYSLRDASTTLDRGCRIGRIFYYPTDGSASQGGKEIIAIDLTKPGVMHPYPALDGRRIYASYDNPRLFCHEGSVYFEGLLPDSDKRDTALFRFEVATSRLTLLRNINTTVDDSDSIPELYDRISQYTAVGNYVVFVATDIWKLPRDQRNFELWRTDGTPAGTVKVVELVPSPLSGSDPKKLTPVGP